MADGENKLEFSLDLDALGFVEGIESAKAAFDSFVSSGAKIQEVIKTIEEMGAILAPLIVTLAVLTEVFHGVFEGEELAAVNQQFQVLAENARIVPDELKEGMIEAAHGMMTEEEAIQSTNKALVQLQTGFEKLPEIMELSRKVAMVMGGTITERFEQINQAIATGRTRMLMNAGIIVDQDKANRQYAAGIGTTVEALSKAEKQQAMMNAVLAFGKDKFSEVNTDVKGATNAWTEFKVAMTEVGESFSIVINKMFGSSVKNLMQSFADNMKGFNNSLKVMFASEGDDKTRAKIEGIGNEITHLQHNIDEMIKSGRTVSYVGGDAVDNLGQAENKIKALRAQMAALKGDLKSSGGAEGGEEGLAAKNIADQEKRREQQAKFNEQMIGLDTQLTNEKIKHMQDVATAQALYDEKQKNEVAKIDAEIAKIDAEGNKGKTITRAQANQEIMRLEEIKKQKLIKDEAEIRAMQNKSLDNYLAHSKSTFDGVGRGFEVMSAKAKIAIKDYGAFGERTAKSFENHSVAAIQGVALGTKSATEAMGEMFGGMVGDMATDYGKMMLLSSVWPPNPAGIAAGTALIALGAYLGTLGGSGGSSGGAGEVSAAASSGIGTNSTSTPLSQASNQTQTSKTVNLIIQGHMFNDQSTARFITDQVRNAADATDFKITSVGGGI